jgi:hypothetical protein
MKKTPLAVFTYNRPDHVERMFTALARCRRLDECAVHIYCDGPKRPEHQPAIDASRAVVRQWADRLDAQVIERSENLGAGGSIPAGVTELCAQYSEVIVLEDDHIVSPDFLVYMLHALDRYRDEPRVYQIAGYTFQIDVPMREDAFFMPMVTSWGWATWQRAWSIYDWDASGASGFLADAANRRRFDLDNSFPYARMLQDHLDGKSDAWDIQWWYAVYQKKGLALYPKHSLVDNIGFDGSGTHTHAAYFEAQAVDSARLSDPPLFPAKVATHRAAFNAIKQVLRARRRPRASLLRRVTSRLRNLMV